MPLAVPLCFCHDYSPQNSDPPGRLGERRSPPSAGQSARPPQVILRQPARIGAESGITRPAESAFQIGCVMIALNCGPAGLAAKILSLCTQNAALSSQCGAPVTL